MDFRLHVQDAARVFLLSDAPVRLITHFDSDGISAAGIITSVLDDRKIPYDLHIVPFLRPEDIVAGERTMFLDLGSTHLVQISRLKGDIIILDHHRFEGSVPGNIAFVNPHVFGIDGSREISAAGVAYMFARSIDAKWKKLAHLALIGCIGDIQERAGLVSFNKEFAEDAVASGKLEIKRSLRLFGSQTRTLPRILSSSSDYPIPGITGSESEAIIFLEALGIPKESMLDDLSDDDQEVLVKAILEKRISERCPDAIMGNRYLLKEEPAGPTRDAKEFSVLLNACGRTGDPIIGIRLCKAEPEAREEAIASYEKYRDVIISAMRWFDENRCEDTDKLIIIRSGESIPASIIGTFCSIISNHNPGKLIIGTSDLGEEVKVSGRACGLQLDICSLFSHASEGIGSSGGHSNAAGALIQKENIEKFLERIRSSL